MSASPFITGNQINQQKTLMTDFNIQDRWHWRINPPLRSTNLPKVTHHNLGLKAFYALGTNFIHIITQKLQISHSSQISLSKQSKQVQLVMENGSEHVEFTDHPAIGDFLEDKITCHSSCTSCSTSKLCISSGTCSEPDHNQCTDCTGQSLLDSWSSVCVPVCNVDYQRAAPCYTCSSTNGLWCTDKITRMISKLNMLGPILHDQHEVLGDQPGGKCDPPDRAVKILAIN